MERITPTESPTGTPAPYGRACQRCSRAKCKCILVKAGGSCERCLRLKKDCRPAPTVRKRSAKKTTTSKTAQLEEKLDGLVSLLQAANHPPTEPNAPTSSTFSSRERNHSSFGDSLWSSPPGIRLSRSPPPVISYACIPPEYQAEQCLDTFRNRVSKYFAFVYIPHTTSAQQLLRDRPFLWLCIMATTCKAGAQQSALKDKIRQILARKMVFENEKDIDLLLGMLAYIAWGNCHTRGKPALAVFTQLAISLVYKNVLNKTVKKEPHHMAKIFPNLFPRQTSNLVRTMEQRRAVLGCFLISSFISAYLQKIDALRWTPHMEECLQVVAEEQECPQDEILVQQVRLQLICEELNQASWLEGGASTGNMKPPPAIYVKVLEARLHEVNLTIPIGIQHDYVVLTHLYHTELSIHEISISMPDAPSVPRSSAFKRVESLYACLKSTRSWFDVFFSIPIIDYVGFPFSILSQMSHSILVLYRLSTLEDPAWDKEMVRKTANLLAILDQIADNVQQAMLLLGIDDDATEGNVFLKTQRVVMSLKVRWQPDLDPESMSSPTQQTINETETIPIDFSDDAWLTEILDSWDS